MKPVYFPIIALVIFFSGCHVFNETSKYEFRNGVYRTMASDKKTTKAYVVINEDSLAIFPANKGNKQARYDSAVSYSLAFPPIKPPGVFARYDFTKNTIDLDVLTILFKLRPTVTRFPAQLNTNFNGALYFGFRSDRYSLSYSKTQLNSYQKNITHYGYSFGVFTGVGSTAMNPRVTNNQISSEYDGVVLPFGVAGIIGVNSLTFGLSVGLDHLLDRNRSSWIYQRKLWAGMVVGLNIN